MKRHYWEMPIVIYLFLGGLGGGIMFLATIFDFFITPGAGILFVWPMFIALLCLAVGSFFLVFELGQPLAFWRVWTTAKAIIKWGATLLVIAMLFGALWWVSYLPWGWISGIAGALAGGRGLFLAVAGISGFGIMVYTGIMLSTLQAHAFWATPALPVLFTISAISTGCAAVALGLGGWPFEFSLEYVLVIETIQSLVHTIDIILICAEIVVLLVMVLSFLGAGNITAKAVARRWAIGETAPLFWVGMIGFGLLLPLGFYVFATGPAVEIIAPVLVLLGGFLLRYLCVYSDERAEIPGENRYYGRVADGNEKFVSKWQNKENLY